jgi:hypothetical protein
MNPAPWTPLIKKIEPFDTEKDKQNTNEERGRYPESDDSYILAERFVDQSQTVSIVESVFITLAAMLCAAIVAMLFYWSYNKDMSLFITILCVLMTLYTIPVIILFGVKSGDFDNIQFRYYMGSSVFVCTTTLILAIYFGFISRKRSSDGAGGVLPYQNLSPASPPQY